MLVNVTSSDKVDKAASFIRLNPGKENPTCELVELILSNSMTKQTLVKGGVKLGLTLLQLQVKSYNQLTTDTR